MRALLDLIAPAVCVGCGHAGAVACPACVAPLREPATVRWPSPVPPGLPAPHAVTAYAGSVRNLVVAYKDRDAVALRRVLAAALTTAISSAVAGSPPRAPVVVTAIPSSRAARRRRGYEPVSDLARIAIRCCARAGVPVRLLPLLQPVRLVRDSAGLTAVERAANLRGAIRAAPGAHALAGSTVVLVDDVVTTGATLAEAARALREAGLDVRAAAVIAATERRR